MTVFDQRMAEAERLLQQGQPEQAKKLFKQLAGQPDLDAIQRGRSCYALGTALYTLHEFQEGCAALDKAWQVFSAELGAEHPATTRVLILLARCHVAMDDMDTGNRLGRQVLDILRRTAKPDDPQLAAACFFLSSGGYPYFPGYALTTLLGCLTYALCFYRARITWRRIILAKTLTNLQNVFLGSLWSAMLYGKGYLYYMGTSAVKNLIYLPFQILMLALVLRYVLPPLQRQGLVPRQLPDGKITL